MNGSVTEIVYRRERSRILGIILWSLVCFAALLAVYFYLVGRMRVMDRKLLATEQIVAVYETEVDGKTLADMILEERSKQMYLLDQWKRYSNLLEIWRREENVEGGDSGEAARIDYKVALFDARERLSAKAREAGSLLPADLGISESIATDEAASVRLLQLAAVEKLVGFALDLKMPEIVEIEALSPEPVPAADGGKEYLEKYPVRLRIVCSLKEFAQFLARVTRARHFFTVGNIRAEKATKREPDLLDVTVIFNALVLKEEAP